MFLPKISENIYILPILLSTVIYQTVNQVNICIETTHHMNLIFYIFDEKCQDQTQAKKDKAWQGMARPGTRPAKHISIEFEIPWKFKTL